MEPKYVVRIIREPLPGKAFELMDAVVEQRANMGIAEGVTTVSIAAPRMLIITTTPYENLADFQSRVDGIFESDEARAGWDRVSALASSTVNNLSRVIVPPEDRETANFFQRYVFTHDSSSRRSLIAALQEMNAQGAGPDFGISTSVSGSHVTATMAVDSLSELEEPWGRLAEDPGTMARAANVLAHSTEWGSGIAKVISRP